MSIQPFPIKRKLAPVKLGQLGNTVGFLLRLGQLRSFECFHEELAEFGIRPTEATVILLVKENAGMRQGEVAKLLKIKTAQMAKIAKSLELEGLLLRIVPNNDRRAIELSLTEAGRVLVDHILSSFAEIEARTTRFLNAEETAQLSILLRKLTGLPQDESYKE